MSVVQIARAEVSQASWLDESDEVASGILERILEIGRLKALEFVGNRLQVMRVRNIPLPNNTRTHNERPVLGDTSILIHLCGHAHRIFKTALAGNSIRAARVDNNRPDPLTLGRIEDLLANLHRGSLELVCRKHCGRGAGRLRRDERKVWELGVGCFHANVGP